MKESTSANQNYEQDEDEDLGVDICLAFTPSFLVAFAYGPISGLACAAAEIAIMASVYHYNNSTEASKPKMD